MVKKKKNPKDVAHPATSVKSTDTLIAFYTVLKLMNNLQEKEMGVW